MVRKVGDFLTESKIPGSDGKLAKKLSVKLWAKGVVEKNAAFEGSEHTQYYVRHAGQFMYGKLDFLNCAFGIVPDELDGYESTLDAPAFNIHGIDPIFLLNKVKQPNFYKKNGEIANGSRKAKRIHPDTFLEMELVCPSVEEQKRIADFITVVDARIEAQRKLVNALKSYKRGFEEALFDHFLSDEENTVIPLGELGFFYGGLSGKSKEDFGVGSALYIPYMNVYKNTFADTDACENVKIRAGEKQNTVRFGDLLFTQSSETTEEVGLTSVWLSTTQPYLNSFCFGFRPNSGYPIDPYYFGYLMRSHRVRTAIMREGQGATRVNLSPERLKDIHISLPHYPQQKYLGALLFKFDQRIKNEELVLEAIKLQRKGLVSKLFV